MRKLLRISFVASLAVFLISATSFAAIIGNWDGSNRSWNSSDMSIVKSAMISAGHTVEANEAMNAANLSNDNLFIIGEATSTPDAASLAALSSWVSGGGILLVFADSSGAGLPGNNDILSGIGSTMLFSGSAGSVTAFPAGIFATDGPPYDIVGQMLNTSPGTAITGGNVLSGDFIQYQALGSGWIFAFADRSDHNYFNPDSSTANGQLFLNLAGGGGTSVPEPASMLLLGLGLLGIAGFRSKIK